MIRTVKDADKIHPLMGLYSALQSSRVSSGYFVENKVVETLTNFYQGELVKNYKINATSSDRKSKTFDAAIRSENELHVFEIKTYAGDGFTHSEDATFNAIYADLAELAISNPNVAVKMYYVFSNPSSEFATRMKKEGLIRVLSFKELGLNADELIMEGLIRKFKDNLSDLSLSENLKKALSDEFAL